MKACNNPPLHVHTHIRFMYTYTFGLVYDNHSGELQSRPPGCRKHPLPLLIWTPLSINRHTHTHTHTHTQKHYSVFRQGWLHPLWTNGASPQSLGLRVLIRTACDSCGVISQIPRCFWRAESKSRSVWYVRTELLSRPLEFLKCHRSNLIIQSRWMTITCHVHTTRPCIQL